MDIECCFLGSDSEDEYPRSEAPRWLVESNMKLALIGKTHGLVVGSWAIV